MTREQKELLAINLITKPSIKDAAKSTGVSEAAVYRLKRKEDFQQLLEETKERLFLDAMQKAQGMILDSLNTLNEIRADPTKTDSARVSSAKAIIELGVEMYDREYIINQIEQLKEQVKSDE